MIAVIAGTHRQFIEWCRANGMGKNGQAAYHIRDVGDIRGRRFAGVVLVGTWYELRRANELKALAESRIRT